MTKISQKLFLIIGFALLGLLALQIPISQIVGSSQNFTLLDLFAPSIGLFLNSLPGAISVALVKLFDLLVIKKTFDLISLLRLLPLPLAAFYFGSQSKSKSLIAVLCLILFVAHPIGRQAWIYSLYWLIPIAASFFPNRLFLRALGSTFTAHAVGTIVYLYTFGLTPQIWLSLIPVTLMERVSFAIGIYLSYLILNFGLYQLLNFWKIDSLNFLIKTNYLPSKKLFLYKH